MIAKTKIKKKIIYADYLGMLVAYYLYNNTSEEVFALIFSLLTILLFLINNGTNI